MDWDGGFNGCETAWPRPVLTRLNPTQHPYSVARSIVVTGTDDSPDSTDDRVRVENASVVWKSNMTSLINATNLAFSSTRYPLNQQFSPGV